MKYVTSQTILGMTISLALTGCAMTGSNIASNPLLDRDTALISSSSLPQASICCQSLSSVTYQPLSNQTVVIDQHSPVMVLNGQRSYFFAGKLNPLQQGKRLTIHSMIGKNVLPVTVQLLDQNFQPTRVIPSQTFKLDDGSVISEQSLKASFDLKPQERYLLIYADHHDLNQSISLETPTRGRTPEPGKTPGVYADARIPASAWGVLKISFTTDVDLFASPAKTNPNSQPVTSSNATMLTIPVTTLTSSSAQTETPAAAITATSVSPEVVRTQPTAVATTTPVATSNSISAQTRHYYTHAIQQAVKTNQIEQAMQLVDEAQRLGMTEAKTIFVNAVKAK